MKIIESLQIQQLPLGLSCGRRKGVKQMFPVYKMLDFMVVNTFLLVTTQAQRQSPLSPIPLARHLC